MKQKTVKTAGIVLAMLTMHVATYGQELASSLFDDVNRTLQAARNAQADVLSPKSFAAGMEAYNDAQKSYKNDGEISDIKEDIAEANAKFSQAIENTKVGSVLFSQALSARNDAMNAEAGQFSKNNWKEAEEEMKDAAGELEKGDSNDAKEQAKTATALYRKAELESIKANYLSNAKKLVEQADKNKVYKVAPKTFEEAKALIAKAEKELAENRYDTDGARYLAKEAEYKALLAMHIAKQEEILDDKDFEAEDYLLMMYEPITKIGEALDLNIRFDNGVDGPVAEIISSIKGDDNLIATLEAKLYNYQLHNENLTALLSEQRKIQEIMKGQLSDEALVAQKRQQALQARIDRAAEIDAKFDKIQHIFATDEAQVFRQQDDVIIRMIGVNFDISKSEIKQEDYALLTKLQQAVNTFDNATIVIEGHTDSQGGDDLNLELSQARADAVLSYMSANTTIDKSRFSTKGFGESKPVANNETAAGRRVNRRIDIVIKPTMMDTLVGLNTSGN
ncbi:OmpA family protein [uncultured Imperialibacter sp.]|uniref:OmpA family protein n=1 Tax=uncultured Imperialibacter sp. TaxID=1672639 RepID=UPI0030D85FAE|tara:strand:+ start:17471 stop:18991 length:1521 start_codon:yes stop_codon:yes gene_type:complete